MTVQWGPRPGGPQVPVPRPGKGPSGCAIVVMALLAGVSLATCTSGLAATGDGDAGGGVALIVFGCLLMAGPVIYFWAIASGPARERKRAEAEQRRRHQAAQDWVATRTAAQIARSERPLESAHLHTMRRNGCAFLGVDANDREWMVADRQQAVLVLGPPRSGKTSSLIIPSILNAPGPVVSTSTKAEVMRETARVRSRMGRVWIFDPSGSESVPAGILELRWSPVRRSITWDGARAMADAMVGASAASEGVTDASHWTESAKMLLAPLLHAAALDGRTISDVRRWVSQTDAVPAGRILDQAHAESACEDLEGVAARTEARERSSIYSTVRIVLGAYGSDQVARRSREPNFDADLFVRSRDTVYITSPAHQQALFAPLVAGLLEEIRDSTYRLARSAQYSPKTHDPVLWALDEAANIAPLKKLPAIVSEAGGQGLQLMVCLQDLSQARARWGTAAEGFLGLFGIKVIFPGIGDKATLEAVSMMAGDWDRPYTVYNANTGRSTSYGLPLGANITRTTGEGWSYSTQREARITPGEVSNLPPGHALALLGGRWFLLALTPYFRDEPWLSILKTAPSAIQPSTDDGEYISDLLDTDRSNLSTDPRIG